MQGEGLVRNTTIVGKTANGRFGHSLASLGDLNNDGFEGQYYQHMCLLMVDKRCSFWCRFCCQCTVPGWGHSIHLLWEGQWWWRRDCEHYWTAGELIRLACQRIPHCVDCDHCGLCDQVITAEQIVSQLTSLGSLTSFGYTLNGQFDVDNNKYRGMSHKANTTAFKWFWIIM